MTKTLFSGHSARDHPRGSLWGRYLIGNELGHIFYDDTDIWRVTQLPGSSEIGNFKGDTWRSVDSITSSPSAVVRYLAAQLILCLAVHCQPTGSNVALKVTYLRALWELGDPPNISIIVKYMSELISDEIPVSK